MDILIKKDGVHLCNPSLEELVRAVEKIRSDRSLDELKILIDGTDENTDFEREFCLS